MTTVFNLKTAKQKLTRLLNGLSSLIKEAEEYQEPWNFPTEVKELQHFILMKSIVVRNLCKRLETQKEKTWKAYEESTIALCEIVDNPEAKEYERAKETEFNDYWEEKRGDELLQLTTELCGKLESRLVELECQEASLKFELMTTQDSEGRVGCTTGQRLESGFTLSKHLLGGIKIPEFSGKASEFDSFWEIFQELVEKQPYSKIEKFSILLSCCKGDAARALRMFPRTSESYDKAVQQLKAQFQDPKRITMIMINQLKTMKPSRDEPRSLRNNLNDIQAIIATLRKQGETVDTTHMTSMVLEKFSKNVQDEVMRKEFDSGDKWSMDELLNNITTVVKRQEHLEGRKETAKGSDDLSLLHVKTDITCLGCHRNHLFRNCPIYRTREEKIEKLKALHACWKCFSVKHHTNDCHKPNCVVCHGFHNAILCKKPINRFLDEHNRRGTRSPKRGNSPKPWIRQDGLRRRERSASLESYTAKATRQRTRTPLRTEFDPRKQVRRVRFSRSPTPPRRDRDSNRNCYTVNISAATSHTMEEPAYEEETDGRSRLMVVPTRILNNSSNTVEVVYALLDSAADQSFISATLVKRMQIQVQSETEITVTTFGGRAEKKKVDHANITLFDTEGNGINFEFLTYNEMIPDIRMESVSKEDLAFLEEHFFGYEQLPASVTPQILIGIDYFNMVINRDVPIKRLPSGLFVTSTFFGPTVSGRMRNWSEEENERYYEQVVRTCTMQTTLEKNIDCSDLWKLQSVGIEDFASKEEENQQIIKEFYSKVQFKDNKIFVCFPWKTNKMELADNYALAASRLHQLVKMKERNPQSWREYCKIIEEQLAKNFIEETIERPNHENPCYYIPHQAVIKNESETTKTRIVLDASSKRKGELSLNDVIHQGPLILPSLCGILVRSRLGSKIMIADVEKAFHMIYLQKSERDAVRFLWLKDVNKPPTPNNIKILRFCRLPFGINASPFLLAISIKYGIGKQREHDTEIYDELERNLYVDNVLLTANDTDSLIRKYQVCKNAFKNISMNLRQFMTNDLACNKIIAKQDFYKGNTVRILGIPWDPKSDTFAFKCKIAYQEVPTKRQVLQSIHTTFDPLGYLIPLLLPARVFLQSLWKANYEWDDPLSAEDTERWKTICENAAGYQMTTTRPVMINDGASQHELHTFVDASVTSYAAAVYIRTTDKYGNTKSNLLMARQRLAPMRDKAKTMTIPRMELLAILIGTRLTSFILKELSCKVSVIRLYSDSQVALNWVQSKGKKETFVENRCQEIQKTIETWKQHERSIHLHYISSEINPADCATRGLSKEQMVDNSWWSGPLFINDRQTPWPKLSEYIIDEGQHEQKITLTLPQMACVTTQGKDEGKSCAFLTENSFSNLVKYRRVIALILKFLKVKIYEKVHSAKKNRLQNALPEMADIQSSSPLNNLVSQDLQLSENVLLRLMQRQITPDYVSKWSNLCLFRDNSGVLRCKGRIDNKHLGKATLQPIILPPKHPLTNLFIQESHHKCGHQGVNCTLAEIRQRFWIPTGRQIVKNFIRKCIACKRWNGRPYFYPDSPPLPHSRVEPSRPFAHVGIDLAGPFRVIDSEKQHCKRWILLATCMTTRAVHLEVVNNLSAVEALHSLRRLIARRGRPEEVISDNATNFKLSKDIIQDGENVICIDNIHTFLTNEKIDWKFITPLSPWKGGFYERMIGIMKSILRKVMKRKVLEERSFATLVIETEAMINMRPLTYAGSTIEDSVILRPIDFLIPKANLNVVNLQEENKMDDPDYFPTISTREEAKQYFLQQQYYRDSMWKIWSEQYLLELRNFHQKRINQKTFTRQKPKIGEVVLIMDETLTRGEWPLGLVLELVQDNDGEVRSVKLKTGKSKVERSINMLVPLEIEAEEPEKDKETNIESKVNADMKPSQKNIDGIEKQKCTNKRQRPFLARRAKNNVAYVNTISTSDYAKSTETIHHVRWHRWLMLAIVTILSTPAHAKNDQTMHIQCVKGGINIDTGFQCQAMEVCGNEQCFELKQPEINVTIQFSPEVILHDYYAAVKLLTANGTITSHQICPPSPFCEQINCNFCSIMVSNPECWPKLAIGIAGIVIYILVILTCATFLLVKGMCRRIKVVGHKFYSIFMRSCLKICAQSREKETEYVPLVEISKKRGQKWTASTIVKILALATTMQGTYGCQQTIIVPTVTSLCNDRDNSCVIRKAVVAKLQPLQPELCLQIKHDNMTQSTLKLTFAGLVKRCRKETLYFTRNTETKVQHRKRCPHMGSCTGSKCARITPNSKVEELDIANNYTGITYCTESCGGIGCSCGFPSSGCLFYRVYHVPTDDRIFEVFQCPTWSEMVKLNYQESQRHRQVLSYSKVGMQPHTNKQMGSIKVEVTSVITSPIMLMSKRFLSDGTNTAYINEDTSFSYACERNPSLENSTCAIKDTCACNPAEDSANCYCKHNNVSVLMSLTNTLPIPLPGGVVKTEGKNKEPTIHTEMATIELAILLDATVTNIDQRYTDFTCNIIPITVRGCYSCIKGAVAELTCYSDMSHATAQVSCSNQQFTLSCAPKGIKNEVRLFWNTALLKEQCKAECGKQTTVFEIKGTLNYVNGMKPIFQYFKIGNDTEFDSEGLNFQLPDIMHFLDVCKNYFIYSACVFASIATVTLITMDGEREEEAQPPQEPDPRHPPVDLEEEMEDEAEPIGNERVFVSFVQPREPEDLQPTAGIKAELVRINARLTNLEGQIATIAQRKRASSASKEREIKKSKKQASQYTTSQLQRMENRYWRDKDGDKKFGEGQEKMESYRKREEEEEKRKKQRSPSPGPSGTRMQYCTLCSGEHWATQCKRYRSLEERFHRIQELKKCERCLKHADHLVTSCSTKSLCYYCERAGRKEEASKHHSVFCPFEFDMTRK